MAGVKRTRLGFTGGVFTSVLLFSVIIAPVADANYGLNAWQGYFTGTNYAHFGTRVIRQGIQVGDINSFVGAIKGYLGGTNQQKVGASFIICTMLGYNSRSGCGITPSTAQINTWETRVRQYAAAGLIDWNITLPYSVNTITPCVRTSDNTCGTIRSDVVWHNNSGSAPSIRFRNPNGTTAYIIKRECANPLGGSIGLPSLVLGIFDGANCTKAWGWAFSQARPEYSLPAHVQVDGTTRIWGTADVPRPDVNRAYNIPGDHGFDLDISSWVSDGGSHTIRVYTYEVNSAGAAIGSPILIGTRTVSGCVNFNLTPSVSTNTSGAVEAGAIIGVNPSVHNSGTTISTNVAWELNSFRVSPTNNVPTYSNYDSNNVPCLFYVGAGVSNCGLASFSSGGVSSNTFRFPVGTHNYTARTAVMDDLPAGTKVCYTLSVKPRAHDSDQWRHSAPACVVIGKRPKVQIHGGDLMVGRFIGQTGSSSSNVRTSTTVKSVSNTARTFGSWVEYGIFATGSITGTASGSAYAGSAGLEGATVCNTSRLSFTSAGSLTCSTTTPKGYYQTSTPIPDVAASFPVTSAVSSLGNNPNVDLGDTNLRGLYTATGNVNITGGNVQAGRWVVLHAPNSTVTITGNITYAGDTITQIENIPQVVIIARNINIDGGVSNVDAWLVAKGGTGQGKINTCSSVDEDANLSVNICNQPLTVNGPVMARTLLLRRTAGSESGNSSGDPAEVFNLRPDAYLWAVARALETSRAQTVYTTELPPRF